jgi:nucleoid-associated protein YgaU
VSTPFLGYPGLVWQACYQALTWYYGQVSGGLTAPTQVAATETITATLRNGINAVDAWQAQNTLAVEATALTAVAALPLTLDPTTVAYLSARLTGVQQAAAGIALLPPAISIANVASRMAAGTPAVADPLYLEWCMGFSGEPAPAGLAASGIPTYASGAASAWSTIATAVATYQGNSPTQTYDTAARMARCSGVVSVDLNAFTSGPFAATVVPAQTLWSQIVALPTILVDVASLSQAPSTLLAQQYGEIRYALASVYATLSALLVTLRQPVGNQVATTTVRGGDSLQDIATRALGDFEQWPSVAAANNLLPPYPGPSNGALIGGRILLPTPGAPPPVSGAPVISYDANVLGTDWDFGPINGPFPPWLGDINLITGLLNFARALGRRIQTPLGSLLYHPTYGSRIPGEVGNIQSQDEAQRLAAFGRSAIAADPRTGRILSSVATLQPGFLASFQAVVQPIGNASTATQIDETLSPLP